MFIIDVMVVRDVKWFDMGGGSNVNGIVNISVGYLVKRKCYVWSNNVIFLFEVKKRLLF